MAPVDSDNGTDRMKAGGEFGEYVEAWRERLAGEERSRSKHARLLLPVAQDCADCLVREYGVTEVYLFGYSSRRDSFTSARTSTWRW